jgi:predicted outer membrane repeat protein
MWFSSWLRTRERHGPRRPRLLFRPRFESPEDRTVPSKFNLTVSSLADSGPGTLRAAILTADAGSPSDKFTIGFSVAGTIDLQSPLSDLNNSIAIQGPGATSLTVERAAGFSFTSAVVTVDAGQTASLSGLTIANGNAGGITNDGTLTVSGCTISGNSDGVGLYGFTFGGGIANHGGTLTVSGCTISGNSAEYGGGIYSVEDFGPTTLTVSDSTLSGNSATFGGGIVNGGQLTVSGSTFSGNSADDGGGIFNGGTLTVSGSTLSGNSASFEGGGIHNQSTLTVSGSTISGNSAADRGGGISNDFGTQTVSGSTICGNSATYGGGIFNRPFRKL